MDLEMQSKKNIHIDFYFTVFSFVHSSSRQNSSSLSPMRWLSFRVVSCAFLFGIQKYEYKWNKYDNQYVNGCIVTNRCCCRRSFFVVVIQIDFFYFGRCCCCCACFFYIFDQSFFFIEGAHKIFTIITLFIRRNFIRLMVDMMRVMLYRFTLPLSIR